MKGAGVIANLVRKVLSGFSQRSTVRRTVSNRQCLPRPRSTPPLYYLKIYGGYLWIVLLLYVNPYALRLKRSVTCVKPEFLDLIPRLVVCLMTSEKCKHLHPYIPKETISF